LPRYRRPSGHLVPSGYTASNMPSRHQDAGRQTCCRRACVAAVEGARPSGLTGSALIRHSAATPCQGTPDGPDAVAYGRPVIRLLLRPLRTRPTPSTRNVGDPTKPRSCASCSVSTTTTLTSGSAIHAARAALRRTDRRALFGKPAPPVAPQAQRKYVVDRLSTIIGGRLWHLIARSLREPLSPRMSWCS
jgi:hypothetical protein